METKKNNRIILSTAYLPNLQYFSKLLHGEIVVEQHENYLKQTFRNRCEILAANGIMPLTIPVKHNGEAKTKIRDIKIDYTGNWQRLHWRTIDSAYRSSPFFVYYADDFMPFYEKKEVFLFDFNCKMLNKLIELTGIKTKITFSDSYLHDCEMDYRNLISPKNKIEDPYFLPVPYYQVFSEKFGFQPNLSILDLLCNEGNNSYSVIERVRTDTKYFK